MATDRFAKAVHCATCGKRGVVHLEQEDGWAFVKGNQHTDVAELPEGFKDIGRRGSPEIVCADCDPR
jgi:hypothetical protein